MFKELFTESKESLLLEGITSKDFLDNTIKVAKRGPERIAKIQGKKIEYYLGKIKGSKVTTLDATELHNADLIIVVLPSGKTAHLKIEGK